MPFRLVTVSELDFCPAAIPTDSAFKVDIKRGRGALFVRPVHARIHVGWAVWLSFFGFVAKGLKKEGGWAHATSSRRMISNHSSEFLSRYPKRKRPHSFLNVDTMSEHEWLAQQFEQNRSNLRAVAYRLLGSAGCAGLIRILSMAIPKAFESTASTTPPRIPGSNPSHPFRSLPVSPACSLPLSFRGSLHRAPLRD